MTPHRTLLRRLLATGSACLLSFALAAPFTGPSAYAASDSFPTTLALPNGFLPEGITIDTDTAQAYFGSRADGSIWGIDLRTGDGYPVSPGPGTASVGLKIDDQDRLFVSGGPTGSGRVVDATTGAVLASYQFTTGASFVNDVVLTEDAAWFTDSLQAQLYKVPLGADGSLPDAADVETLPLSGDWEQVDGFNANGISIAPDGTGLIVVNSAAATLYLVDPDTGEATEIDLGGVPMTAGDGLLLVRDRILLVVQNRLNTVAVVRLSEDGLSGDLVNQITDPGFDVPTTVARFGSRLYLPNARFTTPPTPETTYTVTAVSMRGLTSG